MIKSELMTVKEAAEYLKISRSLMYKIVGRRQIAHYSIAGKKLVKLSDIEKYLEKSRICDIGTAIGKINFDNF
jgi:excisionase family DNA binding protein